MTAAKPVRVLVVDDDAACVELLKTLLALEPNIEVVGHASDGREAVGLTAALRPDVVLMDVNMPHMDGIEATQHITAAFPATSVVVVSACDAAAYAEHARRAGAVTYATKDAAFADLGRIIKSALAATLPIAACA